MGPPSHANLRALQCFVAVAREGSVSKAATTVHLSQSAVSLQLKSLEEALGLSLFDRTPRGLQLTAHGETLLEHAESCLASLERLAQAAASLRGLTREILRIGTILDSDFTRLGALLAALAKAAPTLAVELRYGTSDDALTRVTRRELDAGFYLDTPGNPVPTGPGARDASGRPVKYRMRKLRQFVYRVAAPPGWEARVIGKDWRDLARLPWLATPAASAHRRLLSRVFGPLGVEPRRSAATDQEASTLDLLSSGAGLSLVREDVARHESRARGLVIADRVGLECVMSFVSLESRADDLPIAPVWPVLDEIWGGETYRPDADPMFTGSSAAPRPSPRTSRRRRG